MKAKDTRIAVIGLGYVGLPLAVEFGKKYPTIGFDVNRSRINALISGNDSTLEVDTAALESATHLSYTTDVDKLKTCNVYIVTVSEKLAKSTGNPDLAITPLKWAKKGLPVMVLTLVICTVIMYLFFDYYSLPLHP